MTRDDVIAALKRAASEDYLYEPDVKLLRALADALEKAYQAEVKFPDDRHYGYKHVLIIPWSDK